MITITNQDSLKDLELFSKIHSSVVSLWGTIELYSYLSNILVDTRSHTRQGFPTKVAASILTLHRENIKILEDKGYNFPNFEIVFKRG